jgi:hypothetical protein
MFVQVKKQELCKILEPRPLIREGRGSVRFRIDDVSRKHQVLLSYASCGTRYWPLALPSSILHVRTVPCDVTWLS